MPSKTIEWYSSPLGWHKRITYIGRGGKTDVYEFEAVPNKGGWPRMLMSKETIYPSGERAKKKNPKCKQIPRKVVE